MNDIGFDINWKQTFSYTPEIEEQLKDQLADFEEEDIGKLFAAFNTKTQQMIVYLLSGFKNENQSKNFLKNYLCNDSDTCIPQRIKFAYTWSRKSFDKRNVLMGRCIKSSLEEGLGEVVDVDLKNYEVKMEVYGTSERKVVKFKNIKYPTTAECEKAREVAKESQQPAIDDQINANQIKRDNATELQVGVAEQTQFIHLKRMVRWYII